MKNSNFIKAGRQLLFAAVLIFLSNFAFAQLNVGSSSAPNTGAMLEISGATKGVLMPRVNLTNTTAWGLDGSPTAGMNVYNTNAAIVSTNANYPKHPDGKGVYYWDGTGWISSGAGNFSIDTSTYTDVVFVDNNNPNTATTFYTEVDDNDVPVNNNSLKAIATNMYVGEDGSTWIYSGGAYITLAIPKPMDHDWYISKTKKAPTSIKQSAYALGARGIGTKSPTYLLDVQQNKAAGSTPVSNAIVANFQNRGGNVALRIGNNSGRFYLGRTNTTSPFTPDMPANCIYLGQHVLGGGPARIAFGDGFGTATPSIDMLIDPGSGNVGIGNVALPDRLTISGGSINITDDAHGLTFGTSRNTGVFKRTSEFATGSADLIVRGQGGVLFLSDANNNANASVADYDGSFLWGLRDTSFTGANFRETMRLNNLGNLGVGNIAPTDRVTVTSGSVNVTTNLQGYALNSRTNGMFRVQADLSGGNDVGIRAAGAMIFASDANNDISGPQSQGFVWGHGDSTFSGANFQEHMRLTTTGYLGIGHASPLAPLHFAGASPQNRKIVLNDNGSTDDHHFTGFGNNGLSLRYQVVNTNADHVFYAGTGPTTSQQLMRIDGLTGNVTITGSCTATSHPVSSDARFKKNIQPYGVGALAQIMALQPKTYTYKSDRELKEVMGIRDDKDGIIGMPQGNQFGFIAQEMETVIPQVVITDKNGFKGIDYGHLTPVIVKAMQQQQEEIETLKAQVKALTELLKK